MKFCSKCGAPCADDINRCPECGNYFTENQNDNTNTNNTGNPYSQQYNPGNSNPNGGQYQYGNPNPNNGQFQNNSFHPLGIIERNIALAIIFSIITCGIYGFYWMYTLNDEINRLSGEQNATSGGMVILFTIITCGIYELYWLYKIGERVDRINRTDGNSNILFLVVGILGFGIIGYAIAQDTINKVVRGQQGRY